MTGDQGTAKTVELGCPTCREVVYPGEEFCEACGQRLDPRSGAAPIRLRRCTGCDATAIDADGYCEHCGLRQPVDRDHVEMELPDGAAAGVSDRGLRYSRNEDALAIAPWRGGVAVVVCDGVGSSPRPEDASKAAAETAVASLVAALDDGTDAETAMRTAIARAGDAVAALAGSPDEAPSCTLVAAVVAPGTVTVGWVGDSRAYWLAASAGGSRRLTEDDSWAAAMVAEGALTEAEAEAHPNAHVITAWLGADAEDIAPHVRTHPVQGPGAVVVCSDGLWNYLPAPEQLTAVLTATPGSPLDAVRPLEAAGVLVRHALDAGGRDNVTVAVVPVPQVSAWKDAPPANSSVPPSTEHLR
ncbi:PP2C family serine/threonine-protein phosphatase [Actinomadura sp. NPDC047616]|uniref:PP2C family serine/threonine-protein phosphatase n=1 Tax=Actinomadura sp. NPDC047616 TaxID=3155914 RepID=UPI0033DFBA2A